MSLGMLDIDGCANEWANEKVAGAVNNLDARNPCDAWDVRTLLDHMLDTQRYFVANGRGKAAPLPAPARLGPRRGDRAGHSHARRASRGRLPDDPRPLHRRAAQRGLQTSDRGR
jgi:hypothetical protein